jgi:tetratricopeptide (TPR) repeat protein
VQEIIPGRVSRYAAVSAVIAVLCLASYWSIRLALADQEFRANTLDALALAVQLDRGNARYSAALAEFEEAEGLDSSAVLAEACRLDPLNSFVWMRRGLRAESEGDYSHAEMFLLEAARVDKLFDPRATLMNFYFRRNNPEAFWRWAREAFAIGYGDLTSLYRLCWRMTSDAEVIRARAIPPVPGVLRSYLYFLLAENRLDAADPIARQLSDHAGSEDLPALLDFTDHLLTQPEPARFNATSALTVWNSLSVRNILPFSPLAPDRGLALTNGDFRFPLSSRGFDWRAPETPDISAVRVNSGGLRIDLSGKQPERCELLVQFVPLSPGRSCRFRYSYQTSGFPSESGLEWHLVDLATGTDLLPSGRQFSAGASKPADVSFAAQNASLARLALGYSRVAGTSRPEGSLTLRDMELGCAP